MDDDILGYDCDGCEIYEYRILRAMFSNDIDIEELEDADPREYCAIRGDDGIAYAISVHPYTNRSLIKKRENIGEYEDVPVIVKPLHEMEGYEVAFCSEGEYYYEIDGNELKEQLESILKKQHSKVKKKVKK